MKEIVPVQRFNICSFFNADPVSRSQAKKLCSEIIVPGKIILDFSGIRWIGQSFAHQIFVVFQKGHPDIQFVPINIAKDVATMIFHVLSTDQTDDEILYTEEPG